MWGKGLPSQAVARMRHLIPLWHPGFPGPRPPWAFVVVVVVVADGQAFGKSSPVRRDQNPFCCSRVWVEFDHLLDMFVHWKRALSVCFVSSALKRYKISCLPFI